MAHKLEIRLIRTTAFISFIALSLSACAGRSDDQISDADISSVCMKVYQAENRKDSSVDEKKICPCLLSIVNTDYSFEERAVLFGIFSDAASIGQHKTIKLPNEEALIAQNSDFSFEQIKTFKNKMRKSFTTCTRG